MFKKGDGLSINLTKRWMITIGIFFLVQLLFFVIDGTALEPNINDSSNFVAKTGRWILESKLFTEWIVLYSFPFFNLVMTVYIIVLLIKAGHDITLKERFKK